MELKYYANDRNRLQSCGFNRTFMELKYTYEVKAGTPSAVLIVPLWN